MKTIIKNTGIIVFLLMIGLNSNYSTAQSINPKDAVNGKTWTPKDIPNPTLFIKYNNGIKSYYVNDTKISEIKFQFSEMPNAIYNPNLNYGDSKGNYIIFEDNKDVCRIEFINDNEYRLIFLRAPGEPITLPGQLWNYYVVK
ncbi:MAG TPA: hypothetical protein VIV55_09235 [Flavobacterium sp.]